MNETTAVVEALERIERVLREGAMRDPWIDASDVAAYLGFSIEILSLYWQTVGSILGTSLFFLIAALIVTALAFVALRLAQRGDARGIRA